MWLFILGFMLGGICGVVVMCLFFLASKADDNIEKIELNLKETK